MRLPTLMQFARLEALEALLAANAQVDAEAPNEPAIDWFEVHIPRNWLMRSRGLPHQAFQLGFFLWHYACENDQLEFKLNRRLVKLVGLNRSTRSRAIAELEAKGLINVHRPASGYPTIHLVVEQDDPE